MTYLVWKLIHIISVIIFLGNITTGLFWAAHAHKTRNFPTISSTFDGIIKADRYFTIPGVIGIVAAGFIAAINGRIPILSTGWILWSIILFSISGIIFGMYVAPLQRKILDFTKSNEVSPDNWNTYEKFYKQWEIWGLLALTAPALAMVIMVLKPFLPGL